MKENGILTLMSEMVVVSKSGQTAPDTMAFGKMESHAVTADSSMPKAMSMKVLGRTTKLTDSDTTPIITVVDTKVNGCKTSNMAKA